MCKAAASRSNSVEIRSELNLYMHIDIHLRIYMHTFSLFVLSAIVVNLQQIHIPSFLNCLFEINLCS